MTQPARWTKTLLDVLASNHWAEVKGPRVRTFRSYLGTWMLKVENHGTYRGYGFRLYYRSRSTGGLRSCFLADEAAVIGFITGKGPGP